MKQKVYYVIIILLIIVLLGLCCYPLVTNIQLKKDNTKLLENNTLLNQRIQNMQQQIANLNKQLNNSSKPSNNKTCTFTQTFHYLTTLDTKGQIGETFIVLEQYQGSKPFILSLVKNFDIVLEKNKAYEITFTGRISNGEDLTKYEILSIKKTNKLGMDQIQESCKEEE